MTSTFLEKAPVMLCLGDTASGCSVVDVVVQGTPISLKEITFRNYYTASVTVKARIRDKSTNVPLSAATIPYKTMVKDFILMPKPHCEQGSQRSFTIQSDKFLCEARNVMALRLILRQPSHCWVNFGIRDINCITEEQMELEQNDTLKEEEQSHDVSKISNQIDILTRMTIGLTTRDHMDGQDVGRFDVRLFGGIQFSPCLHMWFLPEQVFCGLFVRICKKDVGLGAAKYGILPGLSDSILGSLSIILFVLWKRTLCKDQVFPVFHLAVADLLASCGLFASSIVYEVAVRPEISLPQGTSHLSHAMGSTFNNTIRDCRLAGGPVLCLYVITFLVTAAYAVYWYLTIQASLRPRAAGVVTETAPLLNETRGIRLQRTYVIYGTAWLLPVLVASLMAAIYEQVIVVDNGLAERFEDRLWCISGCLQMFNNGFQKCHSHEKTEYWSISYRLIFHCTLLVTAVMNVILYYLIVKMSRKSIQEEGMMNGLQRERLRTTQWRVFQYQLVFISCWAPSLILAVMTTVEWVKGSDLYHGKDKTPTYYFVLYYIQAVTAPLQGFLNAIVYGWNRRVFREAAN